MTMSIIAAVTTMRSMSTSITAVVAIIMKNMTMSIIAAVTIMKNMSTGIIAAVATITKSMSTTTMSMVSIAPAVVTITTITTLMRCLLPGV